MSDCSAKYILARYLDSVFPGRIARVSPVGLVAQLKGPVLSLSAKGITNISPRLALPPKSPTNLHLKLVWRGTRAAWSAAPLSFGTINRTCQTTWRALSILTILSNIIVQLHRYSCSPTSSATHSQTPFALDVHYLQTAHNSTPLPCSQDSSKSASASVSQQFV